MKDVVRVIIADPDPLARRRVRSALSVEQGIQIVAEVEDIVEAAKAAASIDGTLLLADVPSAATLAALLEAAHPSSN